MRILVALGGNALLRRGEPLTAENQRSNVRIAAQALAPIAENNQLVISHGNGPQVGLLALQAVCYDAAATYPLDVLGAQSDGMIGYLVEQELGNLLPVDRPFATVLTMVEVDPHDPAFDKPTKPIGPLYDRATATRLAKEYGWSIARDGKRWRRVVPSPLPRRIFEIRPIQWLLEQGTIVICTGGGGIPTLYGEDGNLRGAEAVIDKDRASALLATQLACDMLILATDVGGVYRDWGTDRAELIHRAAVEEMRELTLAEGSMGPKVEAACAFAGDTGNVAVIGALADIDRILAGEAGTRIEG
ncbi:MAG: carbamate kinase [Acidobacteriota bacterium]